jgi:hypothetical protein
METEIDSKQEFNFETIHFGNEDSSDLGIVCIVIICIVKEFCR